MKAIALILLSAWSCFGQAFTFNDLAFVCQSNAVAAAAWAPTNAYGWWNARSNSLANGTILASISDLAGSHTLYTNGSSGAYFTNNVVNSLPAFHFIPSGTSSKSYTNNFGGTISQPITLLIVAKGPHTAGITPSLFDGIASSPRESILLNGANDGNYYFSMLAGGSAQITTYSTTADQWYLYTVCFNGTHSFIRTNSTLFFHVSATPGTGGLTGLTVGNRYADASPNRFSGEIAEVLMYNGLPSTNDMIWAETNLCHIYGLGGF